VRTFSDDITRHDKNIDDSSTSSSLIYSICHGVLDATVMTFQTPLTFKGSRVGSV
jgi:hypothetical protein